MLVLLCGLFWSTGGSQYTKLYYAFIALPALLSLFVAPQAFANLLRQPAIVLFLLFCAWLLASLCWTGSDDAPGSLAKRPFYVLALFVGCAFLAQRPTPRLWQTVRLGSMAGSLGALACLVQFLLLSEPQERLIGTGAFSNPLLTSHVLGFFCTFWLATWLTRGEKHDWLPIVLALPLFAALVATGSRTPLVGLAAVCVFMLWHAPRRACLLNAVMLAGVAASLLLLPDLLLQRGVSFRPQLWSEALRQAGQHLWLGYGYGSDFLLKIAELPYPLRDPHNVELRVLLELGLVGLALWAMLYLAAFLRCIGDRQQQPVQVASALVIYGLGAGLTEGSNYLARPNESWFLIWIPLALLVALTIRHDKAAS
ncbi:O-antigen ligase family protein [Pseudomonas sp. LRF_L74]|uniref:O-antigen ligase family protein n=1 Tax=Pseudomonas sp. LRF_L74 TaxID=3369422 RepID=UPI003F62959E